jgi:UDP-N-acetylmuramate--alanine ligase
MIPVPHIHFVGIGGIGMSGLARVLLAAGYRVSGCDREASHITDRLAGLGATIYEQHGAHHLAGADLLVISSAIPADNPDRVEAGRRGIPVVKRAQLLGHLTRGRPCVAIAGTHGKTTTTAMIAWILERAGLDPTIFAGGELIDLDTNAKRGQGTYVVAEADEYDRSFLELAPTVAVITNIEADHPDIFESLDAVVDTFAEFLNRVRPDGHIIACVDDPRVRGLTAYRANVITYGLKEAAEWQVQNLDHDRTSQSFSVHHHHQPLGEFRLRLPGIHNVSNALAAIAATSGVGVAPDVIREALAGFRGTRRRFEEKGIIQEITVIDSYAHHPTEVQADLAAARQRYNGQTIWVVFQPHTYSRTRALLDDFAASFVGADHVIVTDVYAARERDTLGVHAEDLVNRMQGFQPPNQAQDQPGHEPLIAPNTEPHRGVAEKAHPSVQYIADLEEAAGYLANHLAPGHVMLTLGAGDVWKVGERVLQLLASRDNTTGSMALSQDSEER